MLRVADWIAPILAAMSSVARAVWLASALHFLRDDREAAARIARARRLDRGVEREQVGLPGDVADQPQDRFDRLGVIAQRLGHADRVAGLHRRTGRDLGGGLDLAARVLDRADQSGGGLRCLAHRHRGLFGGSGDFARLA